MKSLSYPFVVGALLGLSACSVTAKTGHDKGTDADPAAPSDSVTHFLAQPNSGANVTWKGFCTQKAGVEVDMLLVADGHYTISSIPSSAFTTESGVYRAAGEAISFFDSMGMIQSMSCGVEANVSSGVWTVAQGLSCALDRSSKISFFGDCSLIKFARLDDIKAPKSDPAPTHAASSETPVKVSAETGHVSQPARAVLGSVDLALSGTCEDKKTSASVHLDKAGSFTVVASPASGSAHSQMTLAGQYFKTDNEGAYKGFTSTSNSQPVDDEADMTCSGPSLPNGHSYSCIVKNGGFILFTGCSALTLESL